MHWDPPSQSSKHIALIVTIKKVLLTSCVVIEFLPPLEKILYVTLSSNLFDSSNIVHYTGGTPSTVASSSTNTTDHMDQHSNQYHESDSATDNSTGMYIHVAIHVLVLVLDFEM